MVFRLYRLGYGQCLLMKDIRVKIQTKPGGQNDLGHL